MYGAVICDQSPCHQSCYNVQDGKLVGCFKKTSMHVGLSYAAWHPVPTSNAAGEAGAAGMAPGASPQIRRRFSAAFDGNVGGALGPPLAAPAAPTLDAIFLAKGPGPYLIKGAQVRACAVT